MAANEDTFARLVSLAVHDLRTPLATLSGFARTLGRTELGHPADRYVEMMVAAADQLTELLEALGLVARIEGGRWEPNVQEVDARELAAAAAERLQAADVDGSGRAVRVDRDAATLALHGLARCALRHGGVDRVALTVAGDTVAIAPVSADVAPIILGEEAKDLGALVGQRLVRALGGEATVQDERLLVRLPT